LRDVDLSYNALRAVIGSLVTMLFTADPISSATPRFLK
jgi:hypothetical protein